MPEGKAKGDLVNKGRENLEIRLGEKLSDFVELGEVFGAAEKGAERVLEVVRGASLVLPSAARALVLTVL